MTRSIYVDIRSLDSRPILLTCIGPASLPVLTNCGLLLIFIRVNLASPPTTRILVPFSCPLSPGDGSGSYDRATILIIESLTLCPAIFRRQRWVPRFC